MVIIDPLEALADAAATRSGAHGIGGGGGGVGAGGNPQTAGRGGARAHAAADESDDDDSDDDEMGNLSDDDEIGDDDPVSDESDDDEEEEEDEEMEFDEEEEDGSDYDGGGGDDEDDSAEDDSDDSESEEEAPKKKRGKRKIVIDESDDDDTGAGGAASSTPAPRKRPAAAAAASNRISTQGTALVCASFDSDAFHAKYRKQKLSAGSASSAPVSAEKAHYDADEDLDAVAEDHDAGDAKARSVFPVGCHLHDTDPAYFFASSERRDAAGKRPGDAGFNPRTLWIPPKGRGKCAVHDLSEVQKQWWACKETHFDCLLFFKIGKFYEMYHMDADVGVREGGLVYMKGEQAHCGFPELAFGKYSEALVAKGFNIARVEQTETPEGTKARVQRLKKKATKVSKADQTMRREVCQVTTPGTRTYSVLDMRLDKDGGGFEAVQGPTLLVAVKERPASRGGGDDAPLAYGVCVCDAPTGSFTVAEFEDDAQRTRLRTLLAAKAPGEVLVEAGADVLAEIVRRSTQAVVVRLLPGDEFPDASKAVAGLDASGAFPRSSKKGASSDVAARWPATLRKCVEGRADLALSALGAVAHWLKRCLVDVELLSMRRFDAYCPPDLDDDVDDDGDLPFVAVDEATLRAGALRLEKKCDDDGALEAACRRTAPRMALDATTLKNLEVLRSGAADGKQGSLWQLLDHCKTPFGARLLRDWLARPLLDARDVEARSDAVAALVGEREISDALRAKLAKLPDLERSLQQLHTLGAPRRAVAADDDDIAIDDQHPDARAVLFDAAKFNSRKIVQLATALQALNRLADLAEDEAVMDLDGGEPPKLLKAALARADRGGCFPELRSKLAAFDAFDLAAAKKTGDLAAVRGVDDAYDAALNDKADCEKKLSQWLEDAKRDHRCGALKYKTSAKDRYCVDVPEEFFARGRGFEHLPEGWTQRTKTKKARSFAVPEVAALLRDLEDAERRERAAKVDQMRSLFAAFDAERDRWATAVACVAVADALLALAHVSRRPGFVRATLATKRDAKGPFVDIRGGAHPCLVGDPAAAGDVVPNDVAVGGDRAKMLLLSGPNMGGKSTLLRHVCVSAILAQVGCYVKADALTMTPVDRVFTRLGASDKILLGQSTFMVELLETATILKQATPDSLVILDELGRGTATFDGAAIAHSVVHHLVAVSQCRTLFATHYHDLVHSWENHADVQLGHMDCIVDHDSEDTVVFLYKLTSGCSPKSFGINVAKLAKLPRSVLARAAAKSAEFETKLKAAQAQGAK